jgi:hypothetical protein
MPKLARLPLHPEGRHSNTMWLTVDRLVESDPSGCTFAGTSECGEGYTFTTPREAAQVVMAALDAGEAVQIQVGPQQLLHGNGWQSPSGSHRTS